MADMPTTPAATPGEAIYQEARCARETSQELLPLLQLLQESPDDGPGPLDELKGLLTVIVQILAHHTEVLDRLDAALSTEPSSPKSEEMLTSGN
ncbi:hypothetical protein [Bradyrhizobium sp. SZCCHNPS2010]|uniref:hypothetical protein n=1 Tax=Bradyrhizobium sp. SZCCHNPS2010 TaxID=3057333 RepID=UPI002916060B|nr:hypothetical protein [Bradyrhizobium sp. SZCCHNPS2010]